MKNKRSKFRKRITAVITAVIVALAVSVTAFAEGDLGSSTLATGMSNLLNDASTVLLGLAAVVGTVCIIYFCIRRSAADEMDQKMEQSHCYRSCIHYRRGNCDIAAVRHHRILWR